MTVTLVRDPDEAALVELCALSEEAFPGQPFSMREEVGRPWTRLWVASENSAPRAFLIGWHVADELHILNVATAPSARRRGMADHLLKCAVEYARENHLRLLLLEVRRSNGAAIALYRKHQFSVLGVRKAYYSDNDEDAVEMVLSLDPVTGQVLPRADEPF
ncbi:MAG: ribosomal protein S18-alanine N-acetyltransferase [Polyangiaceae bacterium]|nr:ribosomal protein S18-alanine N-acetyltransferase [Polyangiaceae bacterium]